MILPLRWRFCEALLLLCRQNEWTELGTQPAGGSSFCKSLIKRVKQEELQKNKR